MVIIDIFLFYVCPAFGSMPSTMMFAAPCRDLRTALLHGTLGALDPLPWVFMTGNCFGWICYGYLQRDSFLVAANLPGLLVSIWLNYGAAKLQYHGLQQLRAAHTLSNNANHQHEQEAWDASPPLMDQDDDDEIDAAVDHHSLTNDHNSLRMNNGDDDSNPENFVFSPQETAFFRMVILWAVITTYVSWFTDLDTACALVGWAVNLNLIFFFGAPLNTIGTVMKTQDSTPIHRPTLTMNFVNTTFWMLYGLARKNIIIVAPNATGFVLGVAQALLCMYYPAKRPLIIDQDGNNNGATPVSIDTMTPQPIAQEVDDFV